MMAMIDVFQACMIKVGCGIGGWDMITWTSFQLNKNELVRGLPKINFQKDKVCEACQMGKQIKTLSKTKISFQHLGLLTCCIWIYLLPLEHQVLEENLMHMLSWMTSLDTHGSCF